MIKPILLLILVAIIGSILSSCSGSKKESPIEQSAGDNATDSLQPATGATAAALASEPQFQVDQIFQKQLGDVLTSYLGLKETFVASDSNSVPSKAMAMRESLTKVDVKLLNGEAMKAGVTYFPLLENSLKDIQSTTNLGKQRRAFSNLSNSLYSTIKAFGVSGKETYYEFCPMAFNEEGAYWLSNQEKIRNPYFGDKMLTCGEVKEKLK